MSSRESESRRPSARGRFNLPIGRLLTRSSSQGSPSRMSSSASSNPLSLVSMLSGVSGGLLFDLLPAFFLRGFDAQMLLEPKHVLSLLRSGGRARAMVQTLVRNALRYLRLPGGRSRASDAQLMLVETARAQQCHALCSRQIMKKFGAVPEDSWGTILEVRPRSAYLLSISASF